MFEVFWSVHLFLYNWNSLAMYKNTNEGLAKKSLEEGWPVSTCLIKPLGPNQVIIDMILDAENAMLYA